MAILKNLPASVSVIVERVSLCEDAPSAAVVATCSSNSSSSSSVSAKTFSSRMCECIARTAAINSIKLSSEQSHNSFNGGSNVNSDDESYKKALHGAVVKHYNEGSWCLSCLNDKHEAKEALASYDAIAITKDLHDSIAHVSLHGRDDVSMQPDARHPDEPSHASIMQVNQPWCHKSRGTDYVEALGGSGGNLSFATRIDICGNSYDSAENSGIGGNSDGISDERGGNVDCNGTNAKSSDSGNDEQSPPLWATIGTATATDTEVSGHSALVLNSLRVP